MKSNAQKALASEVVLSWMKPKSNFVIVAPPMNASKQFFSKLTSEDFIYSVVKEAAQRISIAKLGTADFSSEIGFAKRVAVLWNVKILDSTCDDATTILEYAVESVKSRNHIPVIVIERFHEALDKLGEDIGTALRNLEHEHDLKTVVELPVSLQVLRERWEKRDEGKAPFLASDWGQGHNHKLLKGYSGQEILELGDNYKVGAESCSEILCATGGLVDLVDRLLPEVGNKAGVGLTKFLQSRSVELCTRLVSWIDLKNSAHLYKKALVKMLAPEFKMTSVAQVRLHDWADILLDKKGSLNCKILAWASITELSKIPGESIRSTLELMFKERRFIDAREILKVLEGSDKHNSESWSLISVINDFCIASNDVFIKSQLWGDARDSLVALGQLAQSQNLGKCQVEKLLSWNPLVDFLHRYFLDSNSTSRRIEVFLCENYSVMDSYPFIQLLRLRLELSKGFDVFQSLQSIVPLPESLLQIYAFYKYGIKFWNFSGLDDAEQSAIKEYSKKSFLISRVGGFLNYAELLYIIAWRSSELPFETRMVVDLQEVIKFERLYEVRGDAVHSTSFAQAGNHEEYILFCSVLVDRFWRCLVGEDFKYSLSDRSAQMIELLKSMETE
ncbi:hypothetical protein [Pseudomonas sp.]|uniref:hypothetical protein n=1 Tax=Pseudomonas sp. TaxID=306 RepID=UPI002489CB1D|nr:hypothetical protein [Pseudomonas sp.]MDI1331737.1 hypothetical protein [Pseudomonas sp.]